MKIEIILLTILLGIISCTSTPTNKQDVHLLTDKKSIVEIQEKVSTEPILEEKRFPKLYCDTTIIADKKYIGCHNSETNFYLINEHSDTVYRHDKWVNSIQFTDFNQDGLNDILFEYMSNIPDRLDLALFSKESKKFVLVEDFFDFPIPTKIRDKGVYYSYHRSGCADSNWDSDLFIIEDYKAIRIGNISGIGCEGTGKTGIFISKVNHKKKELIQEILREPGYYEDKFDFIKDYWTKNHERFK